MLISSRDISAVFGVRVKANRYSVEWVAVEGSEVGSELHGDTGTTF